MLTIVDIAHRCHLFTRDDGRPSSDPNLTDLRQTVPLLQLRQSVAESCELRETVYRRHGHAVGLGAITVGVGVQGRNENVPRRVDPEVNGVVTIPFKTRRRRSNVA